MLYPGDMKALLVAVSLLLVGSVALVTSSSAHAKPISELDRLPELVLKVPLEACARGALATRTPKLKNPFDKAVLPPLELKDPFRDPAE